MAVASAAIFLAASTHAQIGNAASTSKTAEVEDSEHESRHWHLMPHQMQPLLAYLRCEQVPLNRFGEAEPPIKALSFVNERSRADETGRAPSLIPLEVWPGTRAQLQVLAGYGFFGVVQFYSVDDKEALLKALTAAGWELKRTPSDAATRRQPALALVPVYQAAKPMDKLGRELTVLDAHVDELTRTVDMNGLTVICAYRRMNEK